MQRIQEFTRSELQRSQLPRASAKRGYSSDRTRRAPALSAESFPKATSRGRYFIPQSGAGMSRAAGTR